MKRIKTKRLLIAPLKGEELAERMASEPEGHWKQTLSEMAAGCREHPEDWLWYTLWQVSLKDGRPVGSLGFKGPPKNGEVEIGYGIDEAYRQQGYAAGSVKAAVDWAFSQEKVYFVTAETEPENAASQRVLQKLEFRPAGFGAEGPRFEKEKPEPSWMSVFLALGLCIGVSLGASLGSTGLGTSLGLCLGLAVGVALDSQDKKKRQDLKAARNCGKNGSVPPNQF
jgi:RimJ/RimL family protein N-acetyltransferase